MPTAQGANLLGPRPARVSLSVYQRIDRGDPVFWAELLRKVTSGAESLAKHLAVSFWEMIIR